MMSAVRKTQRTTKKNKIFISWSGTNTEVFARKLKKVIEETIFSGLELECFVSKADIGSGTDWWPTIKSELETCRLGKLLPAAAAEQMAKIGYDELNNDLNDVMNILKNNKPYFHSYSDKSHDAGSLIRNAQNDIFVATAVGNKFLNTHGDDIEEKLKRGIQVRYMMLDISRFHEMEEYLHGVYKKDEDIHREVVKKLQNWKNRYPDLVDAKLFQGYLTASYVGIDIWPDSIQESTLIQIMMYQYRVRARQSPIMYNFPQTDEKSYITTVESLKNMWRDGKPLLK